MPEREREAEPVEQIRQPTLADAEGSPSVLAGRRGLLAQAGQGWPVTDAAVCGPAVVAVIALGLLGHVHEATVAHPGNTDEPGPRALWTPWAR